MIHKDTEGLDYLKSLMDGTFKLGLGIGCDLDNNLRYKKSGLTVLAGHANVGKTLSIFWYFTCLAKKHNLKFAIFSSENEVGSIKDDIITMFTGKRVAELTSAEFEYAHYWLIEHFKFIDFEGFFKHNNRVINFKDILSVVDRLPLENDFNPSSVVIDPYNSMGRCDSLPSNQHLYDYAAMTEIRIWCKTNLKSCYIIAHGNTEALRKTHPKDHDYAGYCVPLMSADIEGGGKFVNRCDDFVVIHRYTDHKHEWMKTEWHIKKVKNTKTGGKPTFKENPIILEALAYLTGFRVYEKKENFAEPMEWSNPLKDEQVKQELREPKPLEINKDFG